MKIRRSLAGFLTAQAVSITGTRISAIALPWFVLTTTGSATKTGLVAFCEMTPYVLVKAFGGPVIDRWGSKRASVVADVVSAAAVGAVPVLHSLGLLSLWLLLALVAVAGAARGPGDAAKNALVPDIADEGGMPLERVTGLAGTVERSASTVAPAAAGILIGIVGPVPSLLLDAGSFAVSALLVRAFVPGSSNPTEGVTEAAYLARLREGWTFLTSDRLLRSLIAMVSVTNLLDAAAFSVLLPVWARDNGGGPAAIGTVYTTLSATAILGSIVATTLATRLPRRPVYLVGYLVAGLPRFVVFAVGAPLWVVAVVHMVSGFGVGFINPIIGAVTYERIPRELLGRVEALCGALTWAGIPLGGLAGGVVLMAFGLTPALLLCGGVYFLATLLPGLRSEWAAMDEQRHDDAVGDVARS
ncbi:MAG TPA: MFS transporter [Nocardioidaceae bacterium]